MTVEYLVTADITSYTASSNTIVRATGTWYLGQILAITIYDNAGGLVAKFVGTVISGQGTNTAVLTIDGVDADKSTNNITVISYTFSSDTSRFDKNITTAAVRLHDPRIQAGSDPNESTLRYSLALLSKYQNQAIRDTIRDVYLKYGADFDKIMPEMTSESSNIALTAGVGTLPTDCWIVLECSKDDYSWYAWRIPENTLKVKASRDAMLVPTASKPLFYQTGRTIVVLPNSITGVNAHIWYIQQPQDIVSGPSAVIPISPAWDGEIVDRMVAMGTADAKSSIAV